jgi:hypothetical protein
MNASLDEERGEIVLKKRYDIGIAVDTEDGLVVPVVRNAGEKTIVEIAREVERLAEGARFGKLSLSDLSGGTFTVTSIGSIGGLFSYPVINLPEAAILGVHKILRRPVVRGSDIVARDMMYLSLSFDHRLIDGGTATRFLNDIILQVEAPSGVRTDETFRSRGDRLAPRHVALSAGRNWGCVLPSGADRPGVMRQPGMHPVQGDPQCADLYEEMKTRRRTARLPGLSVDYGEVIRRPKVAVRDVARRCLPVQEERHRVDRGERGRCPRTVRGEEELEAGNILGAGAQVRGLLDRADGARDHERRCPGRNPSLGRRAGRRGGGRGVRYVYRTSGGGDRHR